MKVGLRAHDYGKMPVDKLFKKISDDGFYEIQLALPKAIEGVNSLDDVDEDLLESIKENMQKYGISIAVFGCYVELGCLDEEERQKEVNRFLKGMDFAKYLGAKCIGSETTHLSMDTPEEERRIAFEGLVDSVRQIVKKGEEIGLDVAIEPVARHTLNTPELTRELIERVPSEHLKIIFDPVNLVTETNLVEQETLWDRAFECFGERIVALHMKGIRFNEAGELEKANLNTNAVNFKRIISWLKTNQPEVPVLREEINPQEAEADRVFMSTLIKA